MPEGGTKRTGAAPGEYSSWVTGSGVEVSPRQGWRRILSRRPGGSVFDACAALIALAVFDGVVILVVSAVTGIQSVSRCGGDCGLSTQLHWLRVGALVLIGMAALPVLAVIVLRRRRVLITVVQLAFCAVLLAMNLSAQHRTSARLHGTAPCWNPAYSNADCPWGDTG